MTYELSDEEKDGVLAAPDEKRYAYLINKASDRGEVWGLTDGKGWASITLDNGQRYFPIWPHPGFAEDVITGAWKEFTAEPIEVHRFVEFLDELEEMGDGVALFRTPDGDFITVPPKPLQADLRSAIAEIE